MLLFTAIMLPILGSILIALFPGKYPRTRQIIVLLVVLLTSVFALSAVFTPPEGRFPIVLFVNNLSLSLRLDGLGRIFGGLVAVLWPMATLYAFEYMKHDANPRSFFMFYTMTYGVTLGIAFSEDMLTMYFFYELLTLCTLPLVLHTRTREAVLASRKYLYYSLGGAAFAFLGLVYLMMYGVSVDFQLGGVLTPETIAHVADLFREHGSNVWFDRTADELVPAGFACPKCGKTHFSKENDIMDVWFDSGSTWAAVADQRSNLQYPADVYLEGGDQYRGWFQSSMLTSIACNGVAPYKQIITHGWTVDGEGKAMHKSLGNAMPPEEIIKDYGADMLRLWVSSADYTQDMRISKEIMKQLSQAYLKIRNTARYMLGNLDGFNPDTAVAVKDMEALDRWAVAAFNDLVRNVRAGYDAYEFHAVYRAIYNFCVVEMSNFYLDIIKDRLYCGDDATRASAQSALYRIVDGMTRMLAPILAFTSQEIWTAMPHRAGDDPECVLFNDIPDYDPALALGEKDAARWEKVIKLRDDVNKALENARNEDVVKKNQDAKVILEADPMAQEDFSDFAPEELAALFITSQVEVVHTDAACSSEGAMSTQFMDLDVRIEAAEGSKCPRCWNHDTHIGASGHHAELCDRCAKVLGE